MTFAVVGNPENRRVTMFQAALAAQGLPPARVLAWRDLVEPGAPARLLGELPDDATLRIDSMGEDDDVERAMLRRGEVAARTEGVPAIGARALARIPREVGRILHPRQAHLGFLAVLGEIEAALRGSWRVLQPPAAIAELFDKRVTSRKWRALGVPVPDALDDVRDPDSLRERMRAAGWQSVFVKLASGSSASCLAVFVLRAGGEHAITTVEDTGDARYNTRRLQRVTGPRLERLLGFLLGEGAQVERAIPKAQAGGRHFDLRVLTIDGEPAFFVMRTSPHPITNLHLGGQRGDLDALRASVPSEVWETAWEAAMASCRTVQRASGAFHVGVDLMFEPGLRAHRVIEGNAFGDLLPNLWRDGLDVYGWQIRRCLEGAGAVGAARAG